MNSIVPAHSVMKRHILIDRDTFRSILVSTGLTDVPNQRQFRADDENAAIFYWQVFDFTRMGLANFEEFRGQFRCFDFILQSDGHAFSAQFTRPKFEPGVEIHPQNIDTREDDVYYFVDPGRSITFTAMKGLSSEVQPAPIIKLSTKEYYHLAGFNRVRAKKHYCKAKNHRRHQGDLQDSIISIESNMPTTKTMSMERLEEALLYIASVYGKLVDFYDSRYNVWKFQNYVGKQKALSEVLKILI
jgi:hypothetical protein